MMEAKNNNGGKVIGHIVILDIRKATEESIDSIRSIGNVAMLIYSSETIPLIHRLKNIGNLASSIELSADVEIKTFTGETILSGDFFKQQTATQCLFLTGQITVHPDIPPEEIESGAGELILIGQLLCPEHLVGVIQSKMKTRTGGIETYTYTPSSQLTMGTLALDDNYLHSLDDDTELVVIGDLRLLQTLSNDLLAQKVKRIQVLGKVVCREENASTLSARLDRSTGTPKITTIPTGFELVENPIVLNAAVLTSLPSRKIFCTKEVLIDRDVTPEALDSHLEVLVSQGGIICPEALKGAISQKCNMLQTEAVFYEGELWLVDDELTIPTSRFSYLQGVATVLVNGELTFAPDIEPQVLIDHVAKIHNFGEIYCTPEQMGAVQSLLGRNEGELIESTQTETDADDEEKPKTDMIGNVGYLAL
ncbi:hypothetical protein IH992_04780 [Candidatus Poribacteria bacterium]|nr:hypothetical protein [Candidatus Poribacteria bacterium]